MNKITVASSDFDSFKKKLIETIPDLTPNWSDFNESDIGIALLTMMARMGEFSGYRRDRIANEVLLPTATERKQVKGILKLINYKMYNYRAHTCSAQITFPLQSVFCIPAYTQFSIDVDNNKAKRYFALLEDVNVYKDTTSCSVNLHQGKHKVVEVMRSELDGDRFYFNENKIAEKSIRVVSRSSNNDESASIDWNEVDDVTMDTAKAYHYSFDVDKDGREYIQFNPAYETAFNEQTIIKIDYLVTEGLSGVIGTGVVLKPEGTILDHEGNSVNITVISTSYSSNGSDPESIEHAKIYGPISVMTMKTLVTLEDYQLKASEHPSVKKCKALDWKYPESGLSSPYIINIYVVPIEGTQVDKNFKDGLIEYLSTRKLSGIVIQVSEASYIDVDCDIDVYVNSTSNFKDRAKSNAIDTVTNIFDMSNLDFGKPLYYSTFISSLQNSDQEILYVKIQGVTGDILPSKLQIIRKRNITVRLVEVV